MQRGCLSYPRDVSNSPVLFLTPLVLHGAVTSEQLSAEELRDALRKGRNELAKVALRERSVLAEHALAAGTLPSYSRLYRFKLDLLAGFVTCFCLRQRVGLKSPYSLSAKCFLQITLGLLALRDRRRPGQAPAALSRVALAGP